MAAKNDLFPLDEFAAVLNRLDEIAKSSGIKTGEITGLNHQQIWIKGSSKPQRYEHYIGLRVQLFFPIGVDPEPKIDPEPNKS